MGHDLGRTIDLYAGTGALGIEALSRGATHVDFVERNPRCCAAIAQNLEATKLDGRGSLHCLEVEQAMGRLDYRYDTIFMDAPYSDSDQQRIIERLGGSSLLDAETVLVVEHSRRRQLAESYGDLQLARWRRHGDTCISIYRCRRTRQ